jgi:hypothetical protein
MRHRARPYIAAINFYQKARCFQGNTEQKFLERNITLMFWKIIKKLKTHQVVSCLSCSAQLCGS